ncbi:MAG: hypothetical protein HY880_06495 [Deltaproteobacteria bacterium]|nr:hypothetical protein [Deltaproteobacteria bacterium]
MRSVEIGVFLKISIALLLTLVFFPEDSFSFAREGWEFDSINDLEGWQTMDVASADIGKGALVITSAGAQSFRIISPALQELPAKYDFIWLRLKSPDGANAMLMQRGDASSKVFEKGFIIKPSDDFKDYLFAKDEIIPQDLKPKRFALDFSDTQIVSVDFIRFASPTFSQMLAFWWQGFWDAEEINMGMVNFIDTPMFGPVSFAQMLYAVISLVVFTLIVIALLRKKVITRDVVAKAVLTGFVIAGLFYMVRMDYGWLKIWQAEIGRFSGTTIEQRVSLLYKGELDEFFGFIRFIKTALPEGSKVRPASRRADMMYSLLARYYLLPVKTSTTADYIWTYDDPEVSFDEQRKVLLNKGEVVAYPARVFASYGSKAAIYEVVEDK